MKHLIRPRFDARTWEAADLDAAADFWLLLYDHAPTTRRLESFHRAELRVRGFPRFQAGDLAAELTRRLAPVGFQPARVDPADPDTLSVATEFVSFRDHPPAGLGLPALAGSSADGLYVEVRLTAAGYRGASRTAAVESTLVLVGELRDGELLLKAAWRAGPFGWDDRGHRASPWPHEKQFFRELARGRSSDWDIDFATRALAANLFPTRWAERQTAFWVGAVTVPRDERPRLGRLLTRLALHACAAALLAVLVLAVLIPPRTNLLLVLGLVPALIACWPLWLIARQEVETVRRVRRNIRIGLARSYGPDARIVAAPPEDVAELCTNSFARKYHAELESLGCRHLGDLRIVGGSSERSVFRVYLAPDGVTYISVLTMIGTAERDDRPAYRLWPSSNHLVLYTRYADGGRLTTSNGGTGYRRKLSGPEFRSRIHPTVTDPAELLTLHTAHRKRFEEETGRTAARQTPFEEYLRWCNDLHQEEARRYNAHPFGWADAFNFVMCRVRRAYRD